MKTERLKNLIIRLVGIALVASLIALPGLAGNPPTQPNEPSHVAQLKWLDSADPDSMVQADIKKGVYHFYVFCGLSCEPPGLNKLDAVQCFPIAGLFLMAGQVDPILWTVIRRS